MKPGTEALAGYFGVPLVSSNVKADSILVCDMQAGISRNNWVLTGIDNTRSVKELGALAVKGLCRDDMEKKPV